MRACRKHTRVLQSNKARFHWVPPRRDNGKSLAYGAPEQVQPQAQDGFQIRRHLVDDDKDEKTKAIRSLNAAATAFLFRDETDVLPLSYNLKVKPINPKRLREISETLRMEKLKDLGTAPVEVIHTADWKVLFEAMTENARIAVEAEDTAEEGTNTLSLRRMITEDLESEGVPRYVNCHAEEILFPTVWTKESFLVLVHDLASSTMEQLESRLTYSTKGGHSHAITGKLIWLVKQPHVQEHITVEALDVVFRHLSKYATNPMISGVLNHFEESSSLLLKPKHYHVAFGRAITGNGYFEGYKGCLGVLRRMNKRRIKADPMTLVQILQIASSPQERALILKHLDTMGLTDDVELQKQILGYMAADSVIPAIQKGLPIMEIIQDLVLRHTSSWLARRGAERLMSRLRDEGLLYETEYIPQLLEGYIGQLPGAGELQVLLVAAKRLNDMHRAIKYIRRFEYYYGVKEPGTSGLEILFKLAWECRLYNCTRFLYQYGCLTGTLTFVMRDRITTSLAYLRDPFLNEGDHLWHKTIGRACLGVCLNADYHVAFSIGNWTNSRSICKETSMTGPGSSSHQLASRVYAEDVELFKRFNFHGSFAAALEKAFERDEEWQKQGADVTWPLFKKVQNMSKVPLMIRGSSRPGEGRDGWVLGKDRDW